jgi:DNA-binding transcriptional ArsR family regulator
MTCPRSTPPAECRPTSSCGNHPQPDPLGQLPTGSRITEAEITEIYELARSTASSTLAVLRDEALIYTIPQRGSYVR